MNLAVADIIYPIFLIPPTILRHTATHPEGVTGRILCTLLTDGNVSWVGAGLSVFMLVAIAIERYFAVIHPLGNKRNLTMRKLKVGHWDNIRNEPILSDVVTSKTLKEEAT